MIVETKHLSKRFGSVYALKDINFSILEGEIHGLVGENGAGKSTFINILTGVYPPSCGDIFINGTQAIIKTPADSRRLGINVIHQDRNLIPAFNGIENIYLGLKAETKAFCTVDFKAMEKRIRAVMDTYAIDVPLDRLAAELTPPQKTLLEITRTMMTGCSLLILDEPTASLTDKETAVLFNIIRKVHASGTAVLYITHRMDEIFELTSRVTVFRNGELAGCVPTKETSRDHLISLMTDNWVSSVSAEKKTYHDDVIYSVKNVATADNVVKDASFDLHKGEILGIFGLGGSGRTELLEGIYGYKKIKHGDIRLHSIKQKKLSPDSSIKQGIVLIHEDRRGHSLVLSRSIKDNVVLPVIDSYAKHGLYNRKQESSDTEKLVKELNIKTTGITQSVKELSGGSQQKVVFARALMSNPEIFLCDEPTQAVDVMTRNEIHNLLRKCAAGGKGIVFVTSDLQEMLQIADNILIIANGRTRELVKNVHITSQQILQYCYKERKDAE